MVQHQGNEAHHVGADRSENRERCGEHANEPAADGGPGDACHLRGRFQFAVGLGDLLRGNERRNEALVRDVEEHIGDADDSGHHKHVPHLQIAEKPQQRQRRQGERAHRIGDDHHVALAHAVNPGARGQAHQQEGGDRGGVEVADLQFGRAQQQHRERWDRELRDLRSQLRQGLP